MPLTSATNKREKLPGKLYVVATPIGNPEDITLRAIRVLREADFIAAEDTRKTGKLLSYHDIKGNMVSCHEHNEMSRSVSLIDEIKSGATVALVSDAGTPSVSDPGYRMVKAALENNIQLVPVPGASAAISALSVSGLPTDTFTFIGFLPKKAPRRKEKLTRLINETGTLLFYESPKRVLQLIHEIMDILGDRQGVLSREMTKPFEEFIRGSMSEITQIISERKGLKGECTLLVSGSIQSDGIPFEDQWKACEKEINKMVAAQDTTPSALAREIAKEYGLSRKKVYDKILSLKKEQK